MYHPDTGTPQTRGALRRIVIACDASNGATRVHASASAKSIILFHRRRRCRHNNKAHATHISAIILLIAFVFDVSARMAALCVRSIMYEQPLAELIRSQERKQVCIRDGRALPFACASIYNCCGNMTSRQKPAKGAKFTLFYLFGILSAMTFWKWIYGCC